MRYVILPLVLFAGSLGGCGALADPAYEQCESYVTAKLRSPSTYKRIAAQATRMTSLNPQQIWVTIEYDAANAYGTPIRDIQVCKFPIRDGRADTSKFIDFDSAMMADISNQVDNLEAAADNAVND